MIFAFLFLFFPLSFSFLFLFLSFLFLFSLFLFSFFFSPDPFLPTKFGPCLQAALAGLRTFCRPGGNVGRLCASCCTRVRPGLRACEQERLMCTYTYHFTYALHVVAAQEPGYTQVKDFACERAVVHACALGSKHARCCTILQCTRV